MCPIWSLHLITLYLLALCSMWMHCQAEPWIPKLRTIFLPTNVRVLVGGNEFVNVTVNYTQSTFYKEDQFYVTSLNNYTASAEWILKDVYSLDKKRARHYQGRFKVTGNYIEDGKKHNVTYNLPVETALGSLPVAVLRPEQFHALKSICITGVFLFVSLIFIFFGCAMNWPAVENVILKPVGLMSLVIGMLGKFLFLPLIFFSLGSVIFPNSPTLRLSMFFTGVSPVCGTANIWTFLVGGNLDLSLVMTCVSMLGSFVFMPAWLFHFDWVVYSDASVVVPYQNVATYAVWFLPLMFVGLIVPLAIGFAIQTWLPRVAKIMVRFLERFNITLALFFILLLFSIICAIVFSWDIFSYFTWGVFLAGMCIPWMCYLFGYLLMRFFKQPHPDAIAIAIVTGMLNTSIPISLLRRVLPQPEGDMVSVLPLAVAIMTPIPLIVICIYRGIMEFIVNRNQHKKILEEDVTPVSS